MSLLLIQIGDLELLNWWVGKDKQGLIQNIIDRTAQESKDKTTKYRNLLNEVYTQEEIEYDVEVQNSIIKSVEGCNIDIEKGTKKYELEMFEPEWEPLYLFVIGD